MKRLLNRFPRFHDVIPVFAVIAFMVYAWSIGWLLWSLPSWLKFMTPGEIIAGLSYVFVFSFVESLSFLLFLLVICFVLPQKVFRNEFVARGSAVTICIMGSVMLYFRFISNAVRVGNLLYNFLFVVLSVTILISFFSTAVHMLRRFMEWISDRLIIFLYALLPLSLLSILILAIRNVI